MQRLAVSFQVHNAVRFTAYFYSTSAFASDAFANYLLHSLGFSQQQALSASNRLSRYRKLHDSNFNTSAVTFFRNTMCPKLKFLHAHGFSGSDLIRVISMNPDLLLSASESSILSAVRTLRQVLLSDTHVLAVLTKLSRHSINGVTKHLVINIDLLTSYGIPIALIRKKILSKPLAFLQSPDVFRDIVICVEKKLEIPPKSRRFLYSIILVSGRCRSTNESKCRMFKSFGWTQSDFDIFMMENPCCFAFSDATIKKKLDFLMNELRLKPAYLISNPVFLTCSLEKRLMPRRKVLLTLNEKGLLIKYPSLNSAICMTESRFLDMFVLPFKEVHETYAKHTGCSMKSLTQETSSDSFANYLVSSLGCTYQQALSTSAKLSKYRKVNDFNFEANAISVVSFFKKHGFEDTHIVKMVSYYPRVLCSDVESTLCPKLQFLHAQGFSGSDLIRIFSSNSKLLIAGSQSYILSAFQILRQVLICDTRVIVVLSKLGRHSIHAVIKYLLPNIDLMTSYGLRFELIRKHLFRFPVTFLQKPEKFKESVIRVENKLGIARDAPMFLYGIKLLSHISEQIIEAKCRVFKSFGWTQSDLDTFMTTRVNCLTLSEASIKKKLDFLMNELRLKPAYLISRTFLLTLSLEKTVVPRHKVLLILKKNCLLKKYPSLCTVVRMSGPCFLKRFVLPFKEVHTIYAKNIGCSMMRLTQESADKLQSSTLSDSFANYLVDSLGFTHQQALSTSAKLSKYRKVNDFNFEANAISVVSFFKKHGFHDNHIIKVVSYYPRVLLSNVINTLYAKLQFLHAQGFSGSDFIRVFSSNPKFLMGGSQSSILTVIQILRQVLIHDSHVIAFLSKLGWLTIPDIIKNLVPNMDLLTSYGFLIELIRRHILYSPFTFLRNPEKFKELVTRAENKLGIARDAPMFFYVIQLLSNFSEETIESKCRVFKSFGWTQSDVDTLRTRRISCLALSDASIKKKLDFLMNELRLEPAYLISNTRLLTYSLEKTVAPRHKVLLILKRNCLLKKYPSFSTVVQMSEPSFLKRFVLPFKEVHTIYAKNTGCSIT